MAKEGSVAPRERVNITYKPSTGDLKEELELPFKMVMIGDYTLRPDDRPLEERKPISVDKDNFDDVMKSHELELSLSVKDKLSGKPDEEMAVDLKFEKLKDFNPESVAESVPELNKLLELRKALQALKGPLGNLPKFRKKLQGLLDSEADIEKILSELGAAGGGEEESQD
jgi:type VI secretion system protein ImpB